MNTAYRCVLDRYCHPSPGAYSAKYSPVAVLVMGSCVIHQWNQKNMQINIFDGAMLGIWCRAPLAAIFQDGRLRNSFVAITRKLLLQTHHK